MLDLHALTTQDLRGLSPVAMAQMAEQMLARIIEEAQAIKFKDVKIKRILFELTRLKRWKFNSCLDELLPHCWQPQT